MTAVQTLDRPEMVYPALLQQVGSTMGKAQGVFRAREFFRSENQPDGIRLKIGRSFRKAGFLWQEESNVPAIPLHLYHLSDLDTDLAIFAALDGGDPDTYLAYMAQLIKMQPQGEPGRLLADGNFNVFYVRNKQGVRWAIVCERLLEEKCWYGDIFGVSEESEWTNSPRFFTPARLAHR